MNAPAISVIMPVLNGARFIGDAMRSILRETSVALELIVVDDGSTDNTAPIVSAAAALDSRIRLLRGPHAGVAAARNRGLAAVRGHYVTFLDSDDVCVEGRLAEQAAILDAQPDVQLVMSDILFVRDIGENLLPVPGTRTQREPALSLTVIMFRRAIFERYGVCDEKLGYAEDIDLLLRIWEQDEKVHFDGKVGVYYRRHDANMTNDVVATQRGFMQCLHRMLLRRRIHGREVHVPEQFRRRGEVEKSFAG